MWLKDVLLVAISRLDHIRIVVAGRSLFEAHGSYRALSRCYPFLCPVTDIEAYITYCQRIKAQIVEQSIDDLAFACDYAPGTFVDMVLPRFVPQRIRIGHG